MSCLAYWLDRRSRFWRLALTALVCAPPAFGFGVLIASPWPRLERRQFMAECTTVRGSDDAGFRACATDWPQHKALRARGWRDAAGAP